MNKYEQLVISIYNKLIKILKKFLGKLKSLLKRIASKILFCFKKIIIFIKDIFYIFSSDVKGTLKNIATFTIILGLIFLPSFYAWFNIQSLWDPYGNVKDLPLAVFSEDSAVNLDPDSEELISVGDEVISSLHDNHDINWQFPSSKEELDEKVNTGEYYASIYFPKNFTQDLKDSVENNQAKPEIIYTVNQKVNAIAPKMTDAGANSVYQQINTEIQYQVTLLLGDKANVLGDDLDAKKQLLTDMYNTLGEVYLELDNIDYYLSQTSQVVSDIDYYSSEYDTLLAQFNTQRDEIVAKLNTLDDTLDVNFADMQSNIETTITNINSEIDKFNAIDFNKYKNFIEANEQQLIDAGMSKTEIDTTLALIDNIKPLEKITLDPNINFDDFSKLDAQTYIDKLAAIDLPSSSEIPYVTTTRNLAQELNTFYVDEWPGVKSTIIDSYDTMTDLKNTYNLEEIINLLEHDPSPIADSFTSPVSLQKNDLYPVDNYGSASASFYTTLCLWVGSLLMASILTTNYHGKRKLSALTNYFGRMATFLLISILQAIIVCIGDIYLIGIQISSISMFFLFSVLISITFTVILYTLVFLFGNIGKAIGVIGLVLSISGGGGNFPIEVSGPFFNAIYPYLPFTYGVKLLREAVAGIYLPTVYTALNFFLLTIIISLVIGIIGSLFFKKYFDKFDIYARKTHLIH